MKKLVAWFIMLGLIVSATGCQKQPIVLEWYKEYHIVAHALGGIDNNDYTNSLEAFNENYSKGTRLFEADMLMTQDNAIALVHDWKDYRYKLTNLKGDEWSPVDTETFLSLSIYDSYTPLMLIDLLKIMQAKTDFYVIVDSKTFDIESTNNFYRVLVDTIRKTDESLLDRFIPQAYSPEIYYEIKSVYDFKDIIFTLYSYYVVSDGQKIFNFVKENGIRVVVMHMDDDWAKRVIRDVRDYAYYDNYLDKITIYIHTVNNSETAKAIYHDEEFFGIYSDYITEDLFRDEIIPKS